VAANSGPAERRHRCFAVICGLWTAATVVAIAASGTDVVFFVIFAAWFVPVIIWIAIPLWAAKLSVSELRAGDYRRAVNWAFIPAFAVGAVLQGGAAGTALRFALERPRYDAVIQDMAAGNCASDELRRRHNVDIDNIDCRPPFVVIFLWDGFITMWRGVVFDGSDEITKPDDKRSLEWRGSAAAEQLKCAGITHYLGDHYYAVGSAGCP